MNKDFCTVMKNYRTMLDLSLADLSKRMKDLGVDVSAPTLQRYENGTVKNVPYDSAVALAQIFNIKPQVLMGWGDGYYIDPEAAQIAQDIANNPGKRALFDATRHASPESLKMVADMINSLNKRPEPEDESQDPDDNK